MDHESDLHQVVNCFIRRSFDGPFGVEQSIKNIGRYLDSRAKKHPRRGAQEQNPHQAVISIEVQP